MERIDLHPTHEYRGVSLRRGRAFPFGASIVPGGINFSVYSQHGTGCTLVLFRRGAPEPFVEIPFPDDFRIGNVWTMIVFGLDSEDTEYGFRMDGAWQPRDGHRFDPTKILLDPYAKAIGGQDVWLTQHPNGDIYPHRARLIYEDFDWEGDRPLEIPLEELVIYEMHVRGFTQHPSSGVKYGGTYAGMIEKIPYLKELGINCVELMPIFEFDEFEYYRPNPVTGEMHVNFWGYSTIGFFAPKAGYAASGAYGMQVDELKNLIKMLHRNGIEVFLDVVFNHTAEGGEDGKTISYRGLDNKTYYLLTPDGKYYNFSGTGNTLNCNHPIVRDMVLRCLHYWVEEYHIDGFRFDLASILGRDQNGVPLANPPLLETLAYDPILAKCKLIAEAWDAGGLYQVGSFPDYDRWTEWNGKYRDSVRRFVRGDFGIVPELSLRVQGSPDLYYGRSALASVNFITAHDGFTLRDLVSYNEKHNFANGENNRDGTNENYSWNCGVEGETDNPDILALRRRQMKNFLTILMMSRGVPMLFMGDEVGHTKYGNNNTYCHDNDLNWLNWTQVETHADLFRFVKLLIAFRKAHPVLRGREHFRHTDVVGSGYPDISWHGTRAWQADWSASSRALAFLLCGKHAKPADDYIYVAMNAHDGGLWFDLPHLPDKRRWHVFVNTGITSPDEIFEPGKEKRLKEQQRFLVGPRSVAVLVGK